MGQSSTFSKQFNEKNCDTILLLKIILSIPSHQKPVSEHKIKNQFVHIISKHKKINLERIKFFSRFLFHAKKIVHRNLFCLFLNSILQMKVLFAHKKLVRVLRSFYEFMIFLWLGSELEMLFRVFLFLFSEVSEKLWRKFIES